MLTRRQLLTEHQEALLERLRSALLLLREALASFGTDLAPADLRALDETLANLDEIFLLVVAGEFNSGKSTLINALLGATVMAEGVTPTTDRITLVRYGDAPAHTPLEEFLIERRFPADLLHHLAIVDTPGANAVIRRHEELTRDFVPRADLVLFVTSAERPFTESERAFLALIREWGKKVVLLVNKIDLLDAADQPEVLAFVQNHARALFGYDPELLTLSARQARRARADTLDTALWEASGAAVLDRFLTETLDEQTRIRLKLLARLGVGKHLADTYLAVVDQRLDILRTDIETLDNIESQLATFRYEIEADLRLHFAEVENILNRFELRGVEFFDETLRLGNLFKLTNSDELRAAFERDVVADVPQQIESSLQNVIDWVIEKNLRLWEGITDYLRRERLPVHQRSMIGTVGGSFEYNRKELITTVLGSAQEVVERYDREAESRKLADEVRTALAATALAEAGALGIGTLLIALLHTPFMDFTGIVTAGVVAVTGLYLLPHRRRKIKREFRQKIVDLRAQLLQTMQGQFDRQLDLSAERVRAAIAPYERFIRTQHTHLLDTQRTLSDAELELGRLRAELDGS